MTRVVNTELDGEGQDALVIDNKKISFNRKKMGIARSNEPTDDENKKS